MKFAKFYMPPLAFAQVVFNFQSNQNGFSVVEVKKKRVV